MGNVWDLYVAGLGVCVVIPHVARVCRVFVEVKIITKTTPEALEELNDLYLTFLQKPKKRKKILQKIEVFTAHMCADEKVVARVKDAAARQVKQFRNMLS